MGNNKRILIVDDDESMCTSLAPVLENEGYELETATTGREAIEKAGSRFFDMALIDIRIPDMDGLNLIEPLHEIHPDIEIIMVTGSASLETAAMSINKGASAYITRPFKINDFLTRVKALLEKQGLAVENRRLLEKLKEGEQKIRELMLSSIRAHEDERRWLAFEVHDGIAQSLISIHQQLQVLETVVQDKSQGRKLVERAAESVKQAIVEARSIIDNLYLVDSDEFQLNSNMAEELQVFGQDIGCKTILDIDCNVKLPKNVEANLYRIFHEALLNVRRHATGVKNVIVSLRSVGASVMLQIYDDGAGFDVEKAQGNKQAGGLHSMRWRAEIIGGTMVLTSSPGHGTNLGVWVPGWWDNG